ncbi:His Kinase A (phospho-acceptor) domain-containing protein [Chitinophaga sp. CF118]|uniref:sensor histidine kinase n=1 Tax=Chitinophaga sp. CF118 TaxID=1884367 RepID=UPI0008E2C50F|nr:response regulator [Chitinophaga sp. CF118]SFD88250.1 His Kinase A (phospho-acceptor) domain-containing protein [Chitinophaga sp. CF118]
MNPKTKILIVDDKPENLFALRIVLKDLDVDLVEATSGNDALKATLRHDFALALLDIQMPKMDGYELAGILREEEKTKNLPFIFISAVYTDNLNIFKGYENGAFSFITKPFQPEMLINKVKFFIDKHKQGITLFDLNKNLEIKNKELDLLNKDLESFSYSVSHDLRTPLRAISGYSAILMKESCAKLNVDENRMLNKIWENALNMNNLIDCLLDFSRLGRKGVTKSSINMNELVMKAIEEFKAELVTKKISWNIREILPVKGNKELLTQVYINLISNAIKYSAKKDEPIIEIGCQVGDKEISYYVKDNGAGFDMDYKDKLFGVFQRLHLPGDFEGIGIGLAIVKRIIEQHSGRVWAEGETGKGATFYFSLPA